MAEYCCWRQSNNGLRLPNASPPASKIRAIPVWLYSLPPAQTTALIVAYGLIVVRAHRGTEGSNPFPSSGESATNLNLERIFDVPEVRFRGGGGAYRFTRSGVPRRRCNSASYQRASVCSSCASASSRCRSPGINLTGARFGFGQGRFETGQKPNEALLRDRWRGRVASPRVSKLTASSDHFAQP
jgi:hypothetical protein